jgi:hypothetical protein
MLTAHCRERTKIKNKMKIRHTLLLTVIALGASAGMAIAQDNNPPPPGPPPGEGGDRPRRVPPLMEALDANKDGVIDEKEIANASAALKSLDKNQDGKLTMDEIHPPRPGGPGGPGGAGGDAGARHERKNKGGADNTKAVR